MVLQGDCSSGAHHSGVRCMIGTASVGRNRGTRSRGVQTRPPPSASDPVAGKDAAVTDSSCRVLGSIPAGILKRKKPSYFSIKQ